MSFVLCIAAAIFFLPFAHNAYAQDCVAEAFKDVRLESRNIAVNLAYYDRMSRTAAESDRDKVGLDIFDMASLSGDSARNMSESLKRAFGLDYNLQQEDWLLISQMSENNLAAYRACLDSARESVQLSFAGDAASQPEFFLDVKYRPDTTNEDQTISVKVINGTVEGKATHSETIPANVGKSYHIVRDVTKPLTISVVVGKEPPKSVSLPRAQTHEIQKIILRSDEEIWYKGKHSTYATTVLSSCVKIPENVIGYIMPDTVKMDWEIYSVKESKITPTVDYGDLSSCINVKFRHITVGGNEVMRAKGVAVAEALVLAEKAPVE